MQQSVRVDRIRAEGELLLDVAGANLGREVPTCPGWVCADLVTHVHQVWNMLAHLVEHQPDGFPGKEARVDRPMPGSEVAEAAVALDRLDVALRSLDPETAMWSFGTTQAGAFFLRRAHQETMVHRTDAEAAAGIESQLDGDDAADGIDEQFTEFVAAAKQSPAGSFHVHRTDGEGEWTLRTGDSGVEISRDHQKGDAALRGTGADLLLLLWGRRPLDDFELFGDRELAEQWLSLAR